MALNLGPTQGLGYVYLARLCVLDGPDAASAKKAYINQALTVRPYNGSVLFEAGKEASLAADMPQAIDYWRRSFRNSPAHRAQLIDMLATRVPIEFFLDGFQPDLDALRTLTRRYDRLNTPAELDNLCLLYRQYIESTQLPPKQEEAEPPRRGFADN